MNRNREEDLDKLADAVIERLEDGGESYFGLDGKRPLGFSGTVGPDVMKVIGAEPEGHPDDGPDCFSDEQAIYGEVLFDDILDHIKARWRLFRGRQPAR